MTWPALLFELDITAPSEATTYGSSTYGASFYGSEGGTAIGTPFLINDDVFGLVDGDGIVIDDLTAAAMVDVSEHAMSYSVSRGGSVSTVDANYQGGGGTVALRDPDRRYDPANPDSPYVVAGAPTFRSGTAARITAQIDGYPPFPLLSGWVDSWDYKRGIGRQPAVTVPLVDAAERLRAADLPAVDPPVGEGDTVAERLHRLLDRIGWPEELRDIDDVPGVELQATSMAQPTWTDLLLTANSAMGSLWVDQLGRVVYRGPAAVWAEPQCRFTNRPDLDAGAVAYVDPLNTPLDQQFLVTSAAVARAGGEQVQVDNPEQVAAHGYRSYSRTDLLVRSDAEAAQVAAVVLGRHQQHRQRVPVLNVEMTDQHPAGDWAALLSLDIGAVVAVTEHPYGGGDPVEATAVVRGKAVTVDPRSKWLFTLSLSPAPFRYDPAFTIDESVIDGDDMVVEQEI